MNNEVLVQMVLTSWNKYITQTDELVNHFSDEELLSEIAPGRNRGIYILGHLIAIHDKMLPLLGMGSEVNADLFEVFVTNPDSKRATAFAVKQLKERWSTQNELFANYFQRVKTDEWFDKHTQVSEEDFKKDPKRNRLNIVLTRIPHLTYHFGQLKLLKSDKGQI